MNVGAIVEQKDWGDRVGAWLKRFLPQPTTASRTEQLRAGAGALLGLALTALMVSAALLYNNFTGRRYPHTQLSSLQPAHATRDPAPTSRVGFSPQDLDVVLKRYGQVLDVSRDDLENIILATEMQAYERRFGIISCGDIMSTDAVTVEFATGMLEAWKLLRFHKLHALPVLNKAKRVIGIVTTSDFLRHGELDDFKGFRARLREFLLPYSGS